MCINPGLVLGKVHFASTSSRTAALLHAGHTVLVKCSPSRDLPLRPEMKPRRAEFHVDALGHSTSTFHARSSSLLPHIPHSIHNVSSYPRCARGRHPPDRLLRYHDWRHARRAHKDGCVRCSISIVTTFWAPRPCSRLHALLRLAQRRRPILFLLMCRALQRHCPQVSRPARRNVKLTRQNRRELPSVVYGRAPVSSLRPWCCYN